MKEYFFDIIDTEEKAYWLGFITADGNISRNGHNIQINLGERDRQHLMKLGDLLGKILGTWRSFHKKNGKFYTGCYLSISSAKMWSSLYTAGIEPSKTHSNQSGIFERIPSHLKHHFLRGLFDGDGNISFSTVKGKLVCNFMICGERRLMETAVEFLSLTLETGSTSIEHRHLFSIARWGGKRQCKCLADFLYSGSNVHLERKRQIFDAIENLPSKGTFFGVSQAASGKWNASIVKNGKRTHIGNYINAIDAAKAHDQVAVQIGKPRYKLNFPEMAVT